MVISKEEKAFDKIQYQFMRNYNSSKLETKENFS